MISVGYLNTKNAAKHLNLSVRKIREDYPKWAKWGVIPSRVNGKPDGDLRFKISELDKMMEQWRLTKCEKNMQEAH